MNTEMTINMDLVVQILRQEFHLPHAYVEQTGGGCATIYVGPNYRDSDIRWSAVAGPGTWRPGGSEDAAFGSVATGDVGEFSLGYDDDGASHYYDATEADTEHSLAKRLAAMASSPPIWKDISDDDAPKSIWVTADTGWPDGQWFYAAVDVDGGPGGWDWHVSTNSGPPNSDHLDQLDGGTAPTLEAAKDAATEVLIRHANAAWPGR